MWLKPRGKLDAELKWEAGVSAAGREAKGLQRAQRERNWLSDPTAGQRRFGQAHGTKQQNANQSEKKLISKIT